MMKILIVDDDLVSRNKLLAILESHGRCALAEGGKPALRLFIDAYRAEQAFDLIVLDIDMPDIQGISVLQKIRNFEKSRSLSAEQRCHILMVTGFSDRDHVRQSLQSGCDAYLLKPFNRDSVEKCLETSGLLSRLVAPEKVEQSFEEALAVAVAATTQALVAGDYELLAQFSVFLNFKQALEEGLDMAEAEALLRGQASVSGRLLNISNSSIYRGIKKNVNLRDALSRLGLREALRQTYVICSQDLSKNQPAAYQYYAHWIWLRSLAAAYLFEWLALRLKLDSRVDFFTLGVMHNVGDSVLLQVILECATARHAVVEQDLAALMGRLAGYRGLYGSLLLKQWKTAPAAQVLTRYCGDGRDPDQAQRVLPVIDLAMALIDRVVVPEAVVSIEAMVRADTQQDAAALRALLQQYPDQAADLSLDACHTLVTLVREKLRALDAATH